MVKEKGKTRGKKSVKIKDLPKRTLTAEQAKAVKGGVFGPMDKRSR